MTACRAVCLREGQRHEVGSAFELVGPPSNRVNPSLLTRARVRRPAHTPLPVPLPTVAVGRGRYDVLTHSTSTRPAHIPLPRPLPRFWAPRCVPPTCPSSSWLACRRRWSHRRCRCRGGEGTEWGRGGRGRAGSWGKGPNSAATARLAGPHSAVLGGCSVTGCPAPLRSASVRMHAQYHA